MNRGWSTTPTVFVVAFSGFRFGLPPSRPLYWPAGLDGVFLPTPSPVAIQPKSAAVIVRPAQGSLEPSRPVNCGANSSWMFGARTARLYEPRNRTSGIGANSADSLYVSVLYLRPLLSVYHDLR